LPGLLGGALFPVGPQAVESGADKATIDPRKQAALALRGTSIDRTIRRLAVTIEGATSRLTARPRLRRGVVETY
jgi:hypothetical protein